MYLLIIGANTGESLQKGLDTTANAFRVVLESFQEH